MTDNNKPSSPRLEELEVALKEVELEKEKLELEYLKGEGEKKAAEVEKAKVDLSIRRLDGVRNSHQHGLLADAAEGVFRLESPVYSDVLSLSATMERWADAHPDAPLTLYLFSPGGSVLHGFALYDTLRTLSGEGHEVTTIIRGFAGSMASVIFLAGDRRLIGRESLIHQHEVSSGSMGTASEMAEDTKRVQMLGDKIARIYEERTNMTIRSFKAKTVKKEWYAEAAEALKLGIATEVA